MIVKITITQDDIVKCIYLLNKIFFSAFIVKFKCFPFGDIADFSDEGYLILLE